MLILTIVSRAASRMATPEAETVSTKRGQLEYKLRASGIVKENQVFAVTVVPGIRVSEIPVNVGDSVKAGDTLFVLDTKDLEEQILLKKQEIEKMDLGIQDTKVRKNQQKGEKQTEQARAQEDYEMAAQAGDEAVRQAYEEMTEAGNRLTEFQNSQNGQETGEQDSVLETLERTYREKQEKAEETKTALEAAEEKVKQGESGEDVSGLQAELEAAKKAWEQAAKEQEEAKAALEVYQARQQGEKDQEGSQQEQALKDAYRQAQNAYESAVSQREKSLTEAGRRIEDAKKEQTPDSSDKVSQIDRQVLVMELEKMEALLEQKGVISSSVDGKITDIAIETGNDTMDGRCMAVADLSLGSRFVAQITKEEQKMINKGDSVVLNPGNGKKKAEGLKIESIRENEKEEDMLDVTVVIPDNRLEIGTTAELEADKKSPEYSCTVPIEALRSENNGYYVLVAEETETVLGSEITARRVDVELLEKNEKLAGLKEGALSGNDRVIVKTSKPVKEGDRIWPKDKQEP